MPGAFARLGRYDDAHVHLQRCLDQFTELEDADGQARAHLNLACLLHLMDDCERALSHAHRARELFEALDGQRAGLAASLNTVGWFEASLGYVRHLLGQHEAAVSCYQRAAAMFAEIGATLYRAEALINLGDTYEAAGDRQAARDLWQEALEVFELSHHPETERLRAKIRCAGSGRPGSAGQVPVLPR